jgi:hypothetical protein
LAPVAAVLLIPPIVVFAAGMRTEYVRVILRTFDFCFLQAANTLWAIVFSAVLRDTRVILVVVVWVNFTNSLLQETHLRNTLFMLVVTSWEWLFFAMLLVWLSLELVDGVQHYALITTRGHTLSTKDILTNVIGTMAMLSLRNLYRRFQLQRHHKKRPGTAIQALGYRCKIALSSGPGNTSLIRQTTQSRGSLSSSCRPQPLQMYLATEANRFDPRHTVWPRIGALAPLSTGQVVVLNGCGLAGGAFGVLALFVPSKAEAAAVVGLIASALFSGVYFCCFQRQLLQRVVTSFHFIFFVAQILATSACAMDLFAWRWVPVCSIASGHLLATTFLMVDALTPVMKRRLGFRYWFMVSGVVLFSTAVILLLLDVLVLHNWRLQDRMFLQLETIGLRVQFHVAPFMLGRTLTVLLWSGRYVYVALARLDDSALILLRGNVEFDYESWKTQRLHFGH